MKKQTGNYHGLVAELYDLWFQDNPTKDAETYRKFMKAIPGPALELGSGTGRLLLPFLQEGFDIEGVECSNDMINICNKKAQNLGITPTIHQQYFQELSIPKKYTTIFSPFASFMILTNRSETLTTLKKNYDHIQPNGQIIISMFIPHISKSESNNKKFRLRREAYRKSDGTDLLCHEINTYDLVEQIKKGFYRYEVIKDGRLLTSYYDKQKFRWYTKYEMIMMLEQVGFTDIETFTNYDEIEIPYDHSAILFKGIKI